VPKVSSVSIGSFGLKHNSGRVNEEFHRSLRGQRGVKVFREMADNDAIVGGILFGIESLIRSTSRSAKPAKPNDEKAKEWADFLESCILDMEPDWQNFLSEVMSELIFGWSFFEIIYKTRRGEKKNPLESSRYSDGKIGWALFGSRAQETLDHWEIDETGRILGMWQQLERGAPVLIPTEKSLLFRTRIHKNSPEGRSILRSGYRSWYFKKKLEEIEAIGIERNIAGLPVLQVPPRLMDPSASAADIAIRADLEKLVQEIRMDERMGVVIPAEIDESNTPTGYKLGLLASSGKMEGGADPVIKRHETRIAASCLADFIMLAIDRVGAFSTFKGKANLFGIALTTLLDGAFQVLNKSAVCPLMKLNGCPDDLYPTLEHGDISQAELADISTYVQALGGSGFITPTKELENELLRRGSLPLAEEGEELLPDEPDAEGNELATDLVPAAPEEGKAADTALTGIQITSMIAVVEAVAQGRVPRETGIEVLRIGYLLDEAAAERVMGEVGRGFEPAQPEEATLEPVEKGRADEPASHNAAHDAVQNVIRAGKLKKKPCVKCGNPKSEAHHEDYKNPLKVKWLCKSCHMKHDQRTAK
jgi:ribosomal protein S27AE